ncbi:hypothetical protein TruAng_001382 [Truncatella angustata]|nr:hypothetical protein TruAng_001382 [Truncatella angustata]
MLVSTLFSSLALAATATAACPREQLQNATAEYVASQSQGRVSFTSLASNVSYTENEQPLAIGSGILTQALKIDHSRSIHDTELCATFTELIVTDPKHPYVIGTRIVFSGRVISTIESIVTDAGDWAFNATGYLHWNSLERWDPIPAEKRDSRAVIQAAGDAYFDRFANVNVTVPWGTPCARLEGGAYTDARLTGNDTCNLGVPTNVHVTNRRYVIDQEYGTVDIFLGFPGLDRSVGQQPMPDSHFFRIEGGKIRYIHTVSSCVNAGCGLNGTVPTMRIRRSLRGRAWN